MFARIRQRAMALAFQWVKDLTLVRPDFEDLRGICGLADNEDVEELMIRSMKTFLALAGFGLVACSSFQTSDSRNTASVPPEQTAEAPVATAPAAISWVAHPCRDIKGTPFRKYHSFAIEPSNQELVARTSETSAAVAIKDKPAGGGNWQSPAQFFEAKGITAACAAAGGATAPPTNGGNSGNNGGNAGGDPAGDGDFKPPMGDFKSPITLNSALYYESLRAGMPGPGDVVDQKNAFQMRMRNFLSKPHVQKANSPDRVVDECPATLAEGEVCISHRPMDYRLARQIMFGDVDLRKNSNGKFEVFDYYCQKWMSEDDFAAVTNNSSERPGPGNIVHVRLMNTEHTWAQSKFPDPKGSRMNLVEKTDLHHIFPTDTQVNALRANYEFGNVDPATAKEGRCPGGKLGKPLPVGNVTPNDAQPMFEPPVAHKGNVARALMYFSVRYNAGMSALQEAYLRAWHKEDPVDAQERERNEKIYRSMGVRNPFVDDAAMSDRIVRFCRQKISAEQVSSAQDCQ